MDVLESGPDPRPRAVPAPRRRTGRITNLATAGGTGVLAVVVLLGAEVLPWASISLGRTVVQGTDADPLVFSADGPAGVQVHAFDLPPGIQVSLHLGWMLLLGLLGVALFGPNRLRRASSGAVAGVAVGQLVMVLALIGQSATGTGDVGLYGGSALSLLGGGVKETLGPGVFCAAAAAVLALATGGLAMRTVPAGTGMEVPTSAAPPPGPAVPGGPVAYGPPAGYPTPGPLDDGRPAVPRRDDPLDLTVTPLPPAGVSSFQRPAG